MLSSPLIIRVQEIKFKFPFFLLSPFLPHTTVKKGGENKRFFFFLHLLIGERIVSFLVHDPYYN